MKLKITQNTINPETVGDMCHWEFSSTGYRLIHENTKKCLFVTAKTNKDGITPGGKTVPLIGAVCNNKVKGRLITLEEWA